MEKTTVTSVTQKFLKPPHINGFRGTFEGRERAKEHKVPTPKRTEKLQIMLDDEELKVIDDWRFEHRMPTRAAAIRELIRRGLVSEDLDAPDVEGKTTTDFRIEAE
tara:strand:- start:91268 stop:91585 length:318 start_codon:yes stop_codon:yes gene_type:complete